MTTTVRPVRAIMRAANGNLISIRNSISACGYTVNHRHVPVRRVLGTLPRPVLERILTDVRSAA